jgi:molybdate transport system substrate-binding protein
MRCKRFCTASAWLGLLLTTMAPGSTAYAQSVNLVAAGSLSSVLGQVANAFTAKTGIKVTQTYSPSGTIRQEIEGGLRPDVFASADTASPAALEQEGLAGPVQIFAYNQIVSVVRSSYEQAVSSSNLLNVLLQPTTRIGTSTPVADPLGDYTQQIFQKADTLMPGTAATLEAKRDELVANPSAPAVPAGANSLVYFLDTTQTVDIFITYLTSAVQATALDPTLKVIFLPRKLTVAAPFGLTVLNGASSDAQQFAAYILSSSGQRILASYGFTPECLPKINGQGRVLYRCQQVQSDE